MGPNEFGEFTKLIEYGDVDLDKGGRWYRSGSRIHNGWVESWKLMDYIEPKARQLPLSTPYLQHKLIGGPRGPIRGPPSGTEYLAATWRPALSRRPRPAALPRQLGRQNSKFCN